MSSPILNTDVYFALSDPTRRRLLTLISGHEKSVNEMVKKFDISQPAISQHLKVLKDAGIVSVRKDGKKRMYRVDFIKLKKVHRWVSQFEQFWEKKFHALDDYLNKK